MRALVLAALAACYAPDLAPCSVTCTTTCPADLTCGADRFCHPGGDTTTCATTLSITTDGAGEGHVVSMPAGVDCTSSSAGTGCDDIPFPAGTMIQLTESHTSGNTFAGWSGDACGGTTSTTCSFTLAMPMTINATFD